MAQPNSNITITSSNYVLPASFKLTDSQLINYTHSLVRSGLMDAYKTILPHVKLNVKSMYGLYLPELFIHDTISEEDDIIDAMTELLKYNVNFNLISTDESLLHMVINRYYDVDEENANERTFEMTKKLLQILTQGGANPNIEYGGETILDLLYGNKERELYDIILVSQNSCMEHQPKRRRIMNILHESDDNCAVCLHKIEKLDDSDMTACLHLFHAKCIKELNVCPICREKL